MARVVLFVVVVVIIAGILGSAPGSAQTPAPQLSVSVTGDGKVTSSLGGIDCGSDCSEAYPRSPTGAPQVVELLATAGAGQFEGWGGACSGTGACSVTMSADRAVSARFTSPTPPPPPPPAPVSLTVMTTAGGSVSGSGIACPGDCSESYPSGTSVPLSAAPKPGFAFKEWLGACSGSGACTPTMTGAMVVKASFVAAAPSRLPSGAGRDADGDGVLDGRDACPATPRGTKVRADGCAALDLLRDPGAALDPLELALAAVQDGLRRVPGTGGVLKRLRLGLRGLEQGADAAASGDMCGALPKIRAGARGVQKAAGDADKQLGALQNSVFKQGLPPGFGDAGGKDIQWAELHQRRGLVDEVGDAAADAAKAFGRACSALGSKLVVRGRITKIDDSAGVLEVGGRRFVIPRKRFGNRLGVGSVVEVSGKSVKGGPALAVSVSPDQVLDPQLSPAPPCMQLRIAPVQDFSLAGSIIHVPRGYQQDGTLRLEAGTRLAASPKCPTGKGRYSLAIELKSGNTVIPVAADLTSSDAPVPLPFGNSVSLWMLVVHERRQGSNCPPGGVSPARAAKSYPCPVVEIGKTEYPTRFFAQGDAARAVYDKTTFSLDVEAPEPAKVTSLTSKHPSLPASATFEADGFKPTGNQTTGPVVVVKQNETFALWPKAVYGWDGILFPTDTFGVDHYAGLYWPRAVGARGGKPFRYSAELPDIVTDRLAFCSGAAPDCFYQPPWPFQVEHGVSQGNGPGFSHNDEQLYAFDFNLGDGDQITAARGGIVGDVVINLDKNYNPCDPATPNADGLGNYVRIDHQDGTFAYYVHLKTNTSSLVVGQEIGRGANIAKADNTGRSCGAHLHFQVSTVSNQQYYGQTTPIRFSTWVKGQGSSAMDCYLPVTGDTLISTNG